MAEQPEVSVLLLGDAGVGKTWFILYVFHHWYIVDQLQLTFYLVIQAIKQSQSWLQPRGESNSYYPQIRSP